jgi:two-component system, OmpR family, phosphate regulon sensor histidine kinase PhoR
MVNDLLSRVFGRRREAPVPALEELRLEAKRGRTLVEESREIVVVIDAHDRVLAASRRAKESFQGLAEGAPVPDAILRDSPLVVSYDLEGRQERLVYLRESGHMAAYEELRAGFTAAVSHELRTPLARLLALLETALLPDSRTQDLIEQAQAEVGQIRELIDDVLFLSELESGRELVGLGSTRALPVLREVAAGLTEQAERADVRVVVAGDEDVDVPLRPRMLRVIAANLAENAFRYAGPGATLTFTLERSDGSVVLTASDDGAGVSEEDIPRLFERFYRADRARASRGTGLGLAIVKHIVTSAGGSVEASGAPSRGLTVRCLFPPG